MINYQYQLFSLQISTLPIMAHQDEIISDDEEYAQRQCLRCVMVALKKYFETHLAIKADQFRRDYGSLLPNTSTVPQLSHSHHKPIRFSAMQVQENIDTMFELLPFKAKWTPMDHFTQLGGVTKIFQIIANAYDWTFAGRSEMVRSALDVLAVFAIMPKAQLQFCDRVELIGDDSKSIALNILLGAAEGEIVQVFNYFC